MQRVDHALDRLCAKLGSSLTQSKRQTQNGCVWTITLTDCGGLVNGELRAAARQYQSCWKILERHQFDPEVDVTKNVQGVWELSTDKVGLRDDIRRYFLQREEGGVEND